MSEETLEQETVADIVAEIRRLNPETFISSKWYFGPLPNRMRSYADRIEAAANRQFREVAKMIPHEEDVSKMETTTPTSEKSSAVGNAEK